MNVSNGSRDIIEWAKVVTVILAAAGVLVSTTMFISASRYAVFDNENDPRFPWNRDKAVIEKRISDNEKDLSDLLRTSQVQRESIQDLRYIIEKQLLPALGGKGG